MSVSLMETGSEYQQRNNVLWRNYKTAFFPYKFNDGIEMIPYDPVQFIVPDGDDDCMKDFNKKNSM